MKLLVFSDSHSSLSFMRKCIEKLKPDGIIHLGDHYDDGEAIREENPNILFYQVAGKCDRYRCPPSAREMLCIKIAGVMIFMTHGHTYYVKQGMGAFLKAARDYDAQVALYGHTHIPYCEQEPDGLWVMNPGACGYYGGSAGLLELKDGKISACRHITQADIC